MDCCLCVCSWMFMQWVCHENNIYVSPSVTHLLAHSSIIFLFTVAHYIYIFAQTLWYIYILHFAQYMHVDMDMHGSNSHFRWYLMLVKFRNISLKALFTHGKHTYSFKVITAKQQHRWEYDFNDLNYVVYLMGEERMRKRSERKRKLWQHQQ